VRLVALAAALVGALPAGAEVPLAERVSALEAAYGVVLRPPASEDAALVTEVEAGLAALPAALRHPPGGPLELELHAGSSPLGLGNGTIAYPEWTDGFETAMRVFADAARALGRLKFHRSGVIEQQERADVFAVAAVGEQRTDREPVSDPVLLRGAVNAKNLFHEALLRSGLVAGLVSWNDRFRTMRPVDCQNAPDRPIKRTISRPCGT
jgi:hypothetical protein